MSASDRPRLTIEITEEQRYALQKLIPWGFKNIIFSAMVDDLIDLVEKFGTAPIVLIAEGHVRPREVLKTLKESYIKERFSNGSD